jgi:hypothetical protein
MLAHQVAGKAARDGLFLTVFPATDLPKIVVLAALLSVLLALLFSKLLQWLGPGKVVPAAFAISGALHLIEWHTQNLAPRITVVLIYLHIVGLGAILLSGSWLLLSELFDPREAKRSFGRIAAAGTGGGVLGGIVAERVVAWYGTEMLLFLLAALHLICAGLAWLLRAPVAPTRSAEPEISPIEALRRTPLLWQLAALVFLGTCTAALLDYLFKLGATMSIGKGPGLVRYFAVYYTFCQVVTFLVQTLLTRRVLEPLGIARTVATLPLAVGAGSAAALLIPAFPMTVAVRAFEAVLRGSLFRSGYELLYAPVPASDKRAVKTIIDVGCDRMGDAVGAGAVQFMVWLGPALARPEILGSAIALSAISASIALRIGSAYRGVLEQGLVRRAQLVPDLGGETIAIGDSLLGTVFTNLPVVPAAAPERRREIPAAARAESTDAIPRALVELRSADVQRVLAALGPDKAWNPILGSQVIQLLAWDPVSQAARAFLERGADRIAGQLTDALLDPEVEFGIRRRIPRLLARSGSQRGVQGLIEGLRDSRFEVRFQCGRALDYLRQHREDLDFRTRDIYAAVERELSVSKTIWRSWRILDKRESSDEYNFLDGLLRERADQSLEHVFSLLAVVLPREPLMAAFRGLHEDDRNFHGLALEYLETVLPPNLRDRLWIILEESPAQAQMTDPVETQALLDTLLRTNARMELKLKRSPETN